MSEELLPSKEFTEGKEINTKTRMRVCKFCSKIFYSKAKWHYSMKRDNFCCGECKRDYFRAQMQRLRDDGIPIVKFEPPYMICSLCGKALKVIGTHFKRSHGLEPGHKMTKQERQYYLSCPRGTAFVADDSLRDLWSQNALTMRESGILKNPKTGNIAGSRSRMFRSMVSASAVQIESFMHGPMQKGIELAKERACEIRNQIKTTCDQCGKEFTDQASKNRKYCSIICYRMARTINLVCTVCGNAYTMRKCESWSKRCQGCLKK